MCSAARDLQGDAESAGHTPWKTSSLRLSMKGEVEITHSRIKCFTSGCEYLLWRGKRRGTGCVEQLNAAFHAVHENACMRWRSGDKRG